MIKATIQSGGEIDHWKVVYMVNKVGGYTIVMYFHTTMANNKITVIFVVVFTRQIFVCKLYIRVFKQVRWALFRQQLKNKIILPVSHDQDTTKIFVPLFVYFITLSKANHFLNKWALFGKCHISIEYTPYGAS